MITESRIITDAINQSICGGKFDTASKLVDTFKIKPNRLDSQSIRHITDHYPNSRDAIINFIETLVANNFRFSSREVKDLVHLPFSIFECIVELQPNLLHGLEKTSQADSYAITSNILLNYQSRKHTEALKNHKDMFSLLVEAGLPCPSNVLAFETMHLVLNKFAPEEGRALEILQLLLKHDFIALPTSSELDEKLSKLLSEAGNVIDEPFIEFVTNHCEREFVVTPELAETLWKKSSNAPTLQAIDRKKSLRATITSMKTELMRIADTGAGVDVFLSIYTAKSHCFPLLTEQQILLVTNAIIRRLKSQEEKLQDNKIVTLTTCKNAEHFFRAINTTSLIKHTFNCCARHEELNLTLIQFLIDLIPKQINVTTKLNRYLKSSIKTTLNRTHAFINNDNVSYIEKSRAVFPIITLMHLSNELALRGAWLRVTITEDIISTLIDKTQLQNTVFDKARTFPSLFAIIRDFVKREKDVVVCNTLQELESKHKDSGLLSSKRVPNNANEIHYLKGTGLVASALLLGINEDNIFNLLDVAHQIDEMAEPATKDKADNTDNKLSIGFSKLRLVEEFGFEFYPLISDSRLDDDVRSGLVSISVD